jgi:hypothetical protein
LLSRSLTLSLSREKELHTYIHTYAGQKIPGRRRSGRAS